jgi:hypothetical protein
MESVITTRRSMPPLPTRVPKNPPMGPCNRQIILSHVRQSRMCRRLDSGILDPARRIPPRRWAIAALTPPSVLILLASIRMRMIFWSISPKSLAYYSTQTLAGSPAGYATYWYYRVADACATPNPVSALPLYETFDASSLYQPGVTSGWGLPTPTSQIGLNVDSLTLADESHRSTRDSILPRHATRPMPPSRTTA